MIIFNVLRWGREGKSAQNVPFTAWSKHYGGPLENPFIQTPATAHNLISHTEQAD